MADSSASCVSVPKNYRKIIKFSSDRCRDHQLKKRQPHKYETGNKIVYVSTKTTLKVNTLRYCFNNINLFFSLQALYEKCEKLIHDNENEIVIHCLGAAIQRGILLSLQICNKYPTFKTDVNTLTTELTGTFKIIVDNNFY